MQTEINPHKMYQVIKRLQFGLPEIITVIVFTASVTVTIVLWISNTFESKSDADKREISVRQMVQAIQQSSDARLVSVENRLQGVENNLASISKDISYIRGRLEPRNK